MFKSCISKIAKEHPLLIWKLRFFKRYHKFLNVKHPRNLYEKIVQYSLYGDHENWAILADKYAVREKVKQLIGELYLNELYGRYNNPEDIDFEKLPTSFVLKTNNGCATNLIVKDKLKLNLNDVKAKLRKWLRYPYGELTGQLHYADITPCIIAEKFLEQGRGEKGLIDFKFFCVNGVPKYVYVYKDRKVNTHKFCVMAYDMSWNRRPDLVSEGVPLIDEMEEPKSFQEMKFIVEKLASPFDFVRIDLYEINDRPLFGEYTFTPSIDALSEKCQSEFLRELK